MSNTETPAAGRTAAALLFLLIVVRIAVSPSVYPWTAPAWNAAVLILLALAWLTDRPHQGGLDWPLALGITIYLGYPILFTGISALPGPDPIPSAEDRWAMAQIGSTLLFYITLLIAGRQPRVPAVAVVAAVCASAAFAIRQRLGGFEATLAVDGISEYARQTLMEARVFGLTFSPDMLAAMAAGALPLAATLLWLSRRDGRPAWVLLSAIAVGLLLTALALTRSLGGTLAAGAGMAVWIVTFPPLSRRLRLRLMAGGVAAVLAAATAVVIARGGHLFNFSDWNNPLLLRLDNWRTALAVWREYPLTGAGPGQYGLAMFAHRSLCGNEAKHVHNLLLETLAELGPVGLAGLVLIIFSFLRSGHREFWTPAGTNRDPLSLAFFASGTAILVHAMMDFSWQTPEVAAIFWVALAVTAPNRTSSISWRRHPKWRLFAAAILAALVVWMGLQASQIHRRDLALQTARDGDLQDAAKMTEGMRLDDELCALRAQALYQIGKRDEAVGMMQKARYRNPRFPFYYRDLAMWSSDPAERLSLMRQAVARYPNFAPLNTLLGRVLMDQGKLAEAEPALLHAARACRENGDAMTMLGMLYDRTGRKAEAEVWLRKGAEAVPPSDARRQVLRKFLAGRGAPPAAPVPPAP